MAAAAGNTIVQVDRHLADAVTQEAISRLILRKLQGDNPLTSPWAKYSDDPVGFCQSVLKETLWSKQVEILEAIRDHRRVAVHSAHECSKSFTAARAVAWWLSTRPIGEAFAVTTAPSAKQVRAILWREISRAYRLGKLPGRLNQTEWFMSSDWTRYSTPKGSGEEMVAFGSKPSDTDPTGFQGIHARYVLAVLDEACGIPEPLWHAIGSLTGNDNSRILAIGNPDDAGSYFAQICKPDSGWHVVHVDGLQSPNFTEEGKHLPAVVLEQLIGPTYIKELADDVGEESPIYKSKVRGMFSEDVSNGVVPLSFVRRCQIEKEWPAGHDTPIELGVDVGAGGDETVIRERRGVHAGRTWRYLTPDWSAAVGHVVEAIHITGATKVKVDVIGIGWGVVGRLKELREQGVIDCEIVGVNVGQTSTATVKPGKASSTNTKRFPKLRDQLWWEVGRELSRDGAWDLSAVDEKVVAQLTAPLYQPDSAGRIKVESKADTKKRIRRSPDDADALLLAFANVSVVAVDVGEDSGSDADDEALQQQQERPRMSMFQRRN